MNSPSPIVEEVHIGGVIVYCRPDRIDAAKARIGSLPGAQLHAESADGKLVLTLETDSTRSTLDCMDAIRALPGVLDVCLVYQHAEPLSAMEQEVRQ